MRITVKNGDPSGAGKIWENQFFTGKMDPHGAKRIQIGAHTCQGPSRSGSFTFKAVGVTFLNVIFHLPRNAPIWSFWISLAVVSYLSAPVFLPHHFYIAQHCLSMHGGYWCNKNKILIKIWPELLYFLSQFCIFSFQ